MKIDLVLDPIDRTGAALLDAARAAEDLGFAGLWTYDHLSGAALGGNSTHDVWTLLGAIAAVTHTVGVGPLVTNVTTRHPALAAVAAATLQDISGGRATLGIGAGAGPGSPFATELKMLGMDPRPAAVRRQMVVEAIGLIRGLWSGTAEVPADLFPLTGAVGYLRPDPVPPILVGCNGPRLTAAAAPVADGVNFHSYEEDLPGLVALAREHGGDRLAVTVEAPLGTDDAAAEEALLERILALRVDRLMIRWMPGLGINDIEKAAVRLFG